ncbi:hypothetical protein WJX81_002060 [Elliptochloris bilobata]|uniref:C2H2-type domain-containing protein n=1 Tax=Elliptochloris bilobata TaxID=381761 RepID=A0AAW1S641_9CHLO
MSAAVAPAAKDGDGLGSRISKRPRNNDLCYKCYLRWSHYKHRLHGQPVLPAETEACASVTSAFLQVMSILFEVESLRIDEPRNILALLSTNTRRTKVVELSSGTHRVPDELRRHSLSDGVGGQYSTNLDRNRYGQDDQYLSTVIRYDLEFLRLCPCLVDVEIVDAKYGMATCLVSAGDDFCTCASQLDHSPATAAVPEHAQDAAAAAGGPSDSTGGPALPPGAVAAVPWPSPGSELLSGPHSALLQGFNPIMNPSTGHAASGGSEAGVGAAAHGKQGGGAEAARAREGVTTRPRSKMYSGAASGKGEATGGLRRTSSRTPSSAGSRGRAGSAPAGRQRPATASSRPGTARLATPSRPERIGESGDSEVDEGGAAGEETDSAGEGKGEGAGPRRPGSAAGAGGVRGDKDEELRRLQEEVRVLKASRVALEGRLEDARAKELSTRAAADALRADLDATRAANQRANAMPAQGQVLGQHTWELAKERLAARSQVSVPRMVNVLRVEVQRLNVAKREAEARATANQALADAARAELANYLAASAAGGGGGGCGSANGEAASSDRAAIPGIPPDVEKYMLRQQLQEALAEKQRLAAEADALRECLNTTSCGPALRGQQQAAAQQAALAQAHNAQHTHALMQAHIAAQQQQHSQPQQAPQALANAITAQPQAGQKRKPDAAFAGMPPASQPLAAAPAPVQPVAGHPLPSGGYYGMPGSMAPVVDASAWVSLRPGTINGDGMAHGVAVPGGLLGLGGPASGSQAL